MGRHCLDNGGRLQAYLNSSQSEFRAFRTISFFSALFHALVLFDRSPSRCSHRLFEPIFVKMPWYKSKFCDSNVASFCVYIYPTKIHLNNVILKQIDTQSYLPEFLPWKSRKWATPFNDFNWLCWRCNNIFGNHSWKCDAVQCYIPITSLPLFAPSHFPQGSFPFLVSNNNNHDAK